MVSKEQKEKYRKETKKIVNKHLDRGKRLAAIERKIDYCNTVEKVADRKKKEIKAGKCGVDCQTEIKDLIEDTKKNCKRNLNKVEALLPKKTKAPKLKL